MKDITEILTLPKVQLTDYPKKPIFEADVL